MKAKKFILLSQEIRNNAIEYINSVELDGKTAVTFGDTGSKSSRQNGLMWLWNTAVANSGMGGQFEDTKEGVHSISKYRFCLPILQRDNEDFSALYQMWCDKYINDKVRMRWFVDNQVHTEALSVSQVAEYLTDFHNHYMERGIYLPDPDDKKLLIV